MENWSVKPGKFSVPPNYSEEVVSEGTEPWLEDLESNDVELYIMQSPVNVDLSQISGRTLDLQGITNFEYDGRFGNLLKSFATPYDRDEGSQYHLIAPGKSDGKLHVVKKPFAGHILLCESFEIPECKAPTFSMEDRADRPKDLKQRFIPFGSSATSMEQGIPKKKKIKQRKSFGISVRFSSDSEPEKEVRTSKTSVHKEKVEVSNNSYGHISGGEDEQESMDCDQAPSGKVQKEFSISSKKKKKKKGLQAVDAEQGSSFQDLPKENKSCPENPMDMSVRFSSDNEKETNYDKTIASSQRSKSVEINMSNDANENKMDAMSSACAKPSKKSSKKKVHKEPVSGTEMDANKSTVYSINSSPSKESIVKEEGDVAFLSDDARKVKCEVVDLVVTADENGEEESARSVKKKKKKQAVSEKEFDSSEEVDQAVARSTYLDNQYSRPKSKTRIFAMTLTKRKKKGKNEPPSPPGYFERFIKMEPPSPKGESSVCLHTRELPFDTDSAIDSNKNIRERHETKVKTEPTNDFLSKNEDLCEDEESEMSDMRNLSSKRSSKKKSHKVKAKKESIEYSDNMEGPFDNNYIHLDLKTGSTSFISPIDVLSQSAKIKSEKKKKKSLVKEEMSD